MNDKKKSIYQLLRKGFEKNTTIYLIGLWTSVFLIGFSARYAWDEILGQEIILKQSYKTNDIISKEYAPISKYDSLSFTVIDLQRRLDDCYSTETDEWKKLHKREISYAIRIMNNWLDHHPRNVQLGILGINCLGPVHQGKKTIRRIFNSGGNIKFLLLNPESSAFTQRMDSEGDEVGRIAAEGIAFLYTLKGMQDSLSSTNKSRIEVRYYSSTPDRSIVFLKNPSLEGIIFFNPYPKLRDEMGLHGDLFHWTHEYESYYEQHLSEFETIWESGISIELSEALNSYQSRLQ